MRSHEKAASLLVSLAMLLLAVVVPAASAAPTATTAWVYQTSFGAGEFASTVTPHVSGVAVEGGSGNILAPDHAGQVHVYAPDPLLGGVPLTTFPSNGANNIAVDRETGAVYVNESQETTGFRRYLSDGGVTPSYTLDPNFAPTSAVGGAPLAVDPTTNDVLALTGGGVKRFDPETGELISTFPLGTGSSGYFTVGLDGTIYVGGEGKLARFAADGTALSNLSLNSTAYPGPMTVDPDTGDIVFVLEGMLVSMTPSGGVVFRVPVQPNSNAGLAIDPVKKRLYARATTSNTYDTAGIDTYVPAPYAGVEAPTISGITTTGFHVSTEVDPGEKEGGGVPDGSAVRFEYRLIGEPSWTSTPDQPVSAAGKFEADITGLGPNLTYEVRAVASNSQTTHVTEATKTTTTPVPPVTESGAATDVTETSAVLNGSINPIGLQTTYHFEYGTTTSYGSRIPVGIEAVAGGGREPKLFSRTITGLTPGTTYHFRLVATNSAGTSEGIDRTFTTVAVGGIPARAYEQATPVDKHGAAVISRLGMLAASDGDAISYVTKSSSGSSPLFARSVALRGSTDWSGKIDTDPPLAVGSGNLLVHPTQAVSDDYEHAMVVSNMALLPGGIDQGANLYKVDLATGAYHPIGATGALGAFSDFVGLANSGWYLGGAPDFSWIVFRSRPALLPGAPKEALYRWSEADGLELVSTLPNGDPSATRRPTGSAVKTVTADGSGIYYTAVGGAEEGVFLRENGGPPQAVSVSHVPGDPATPQPANLFGISEDGRYAFLVSAAKLTSDAPGEAPGSEGQDLYRYDHSDGSLEYLGLAAYVPFGTLGVGDDGGTVYFRRDEGGVGPLTVWRDGVVHTVNPQIGAADERLSPDGRYFVSFYTIDGVPKVIQVYDAETDETTCITCLADGTPVEGDLAANSEGDIFSSNRLARTVLDDGTVYFDTTARLVAADVNGARDVYEWKDGNARLISPGNRSFDAIFADASADGSNVFFTTAQKLVGRDNDESVDIYDARVDGGLPAQSPPPSQECLRDDCKATPNAGPELPFGGSEALSGPENVKPKARKKCGKGKRRVKVKGKVKCVKKHKAGNNRKGGNR